MRWCNTFGVCKNPNEFGNDIVLDFGIVPEDEECNPLHNETKMVAAIRLSKEGAENLIRILQEHISD